MGRAINNENAIDKLQIEMKELQAVVEELSNALISTKQVHHLDNEEFTPPVGKRKITTKRKTAKVEKSNAEA